MATTIDPNSPMGQQQQQQAAQYGLTVDQYNQLLQQYPPTYTANSQGGSYGKSAGGSYGQNPDLTNVLNTLSAQKQFNLGGSQQQNTPAQQNVSGVSGLTQDAATNLGAAALGSLGLSGPMGAYAVYNPTPGQVGSSNPFSNAKGGVSQVPGPTSSNAIPPIQGTGLGVPGVFSAAPMPSSPATTPNAQGQLPGTPTGVLPANAPGGMHSQPAAPYAMAPAAPGATVGAMPPIQQGGPPSAPTQADTDAHQSGLINAGKAIFAHFGGDPNNTSPQDMMNFHNQLQGMIGAASPAAQNYTAGLPPGSSTAGPVKMSTGGVVPGRGNTDTVPALLTPGEYVIPKQQAQQMALPQVQRGPGPLRMDDGGYVPDPKDRDRPIPRSMTGQSTQSPGSTAGSQASAQPQQAPSQAPSAPGGSGGDQGYWSKMVQQAQDRYGQGQGITPGVADTPSVAPSYDMPSDPDPDWQYTGAQSAAGPTGAGGGTANAVAGGADVASGLISGIQTAVDTYAKSIKPWQMQAQAFGKQGTPNYQTTTFKEEGA